MQTGVIGSSRYWSTRLLTWYRQNHVSHHPKNSELERDGLSLLGKKVYLAKPIAVWNEQLASELDLEKNIEGRSKELKAMEVRCAWEKS